MRNLIIAVTILVPSAASAGGYLVPSASPREVALGQAAVADQSGAEAVSLNTAALAGQDGLNVSIGGEILSNRTDWSAPGGMDSASLTNPASTPVGLAVAYGARTASGTAWGAGIGFGVPAGGSLQWPTGWAGQEFIQSVKQQVFAIVAGFGIQPSPYFKVGASFIRFQATEELHQSINYLDHFGDAGIAMAGGGNSFGVATEVRVPNMPLAFGATYSHSAEIALEGDAHFESVPAAFQTLLHDQGVTEKLVIPNVFTIGAAYEVVPHLTLMANFEFERWSIYKSDMFVGESGFTVTVPRNYNNAQVYRAAVEYEKPAFLPALTLRGGILRSVSDQDTSLVSPSLTDASSWAVSVGGGYNINPNLRIDVGYQHAFFDTVTASGDEAFPGTYKTNVDILSFGVNWRRDFTH